MRDPKRIHKILKEIEKLWQKESNQDMRFGQLLENYIFPIVETAQGGISALTYFQEDDKTLLILKSILKEKP